jgi:hypothetical protein
MCNLLGEWLSIVYEGRDKTKRLRADGDDDADRNDKKRRRVGLSTHAASTNDARNQLAVSTRPATETHSARGAAAVVEEHLKTLIIQRFDPKKADTIWGQQV